MCALSLFSPPPSTSFVERRALIFFFSLSPFATPPARAKPRPCLLIHAVARRCPGRPGRCRGDPAASVPASGGLASNACRPPHDLGARPVASPNALPFHRPPPPAARRPQLLRRQRGRRPRRSSGRPAPAPAGQGKPGRRGRQRRGRGKGDGLAAVPCPFLHGEQHHRDLGAGGRRRRLGSPRRGGAGAQRLQLDGALRRGRLCRAARSSGEEKKKGEAAHINRQPR